MSMKQLPTVHADVKPSRKKQIPLPCGLMLQFEQRDRGQETPYWRGNVFQDGRLVGSFSNNGTGGQTIIHSVEDALADQFDQLVKANGVVIHEKMFNSANTKAESILFGAEAWAYAGGSKFDDFWSLFIKQWVSEQEEQLRAMELI